MTSIHDSHRALLAVSEAIVSPRELPALFHELAGRLLQVVRFDYLGVYLHQTEGNMLHLHVLEPTVPSVLVSIPIEDTPAGLVWQTQRPFILSNLAQEKHWPRLQERAQPYGVQSFCWLPLTTARRKWGTLHFACKQTSAYDDADV